MLFILLSIITNNSYYLYSQIFKKKNYSTTIKTTKFTYHIKTIKKNLRFFRKEERFYLANQGTRFFAITLLVESKKPYLVLNIDSMKLWGKNSYYKPNLLSDYIHQDSFFKKKLHKEKLTIVYKVSKDFKAQFWELPSKEILNLSTIP